MELKWLEDFLSLCDTGNFRIASEQRFVSQPTFSRRINSLENWLGAKLIDRSSQPVKLTEAGELFKPMALEIVRLTYLSRSNIEARTKQEEGKIRFSTLSTLAQFFLPKWLRNLKPDIEAKLFNVRTDYVNVESYLNALDAGEIDFFICYENPYDSILNNTTKYSSLRIGIEILVPVVSPDSNGKPRWWLPSSPSDVIPYLQTQFAPSLWPVKHHLDNRYSHLKFILVYEATIAASLCAMAREGYGVAWIPLSIAADDLENGRLVRAGDDKDNIKLNIKIYRNANLIEPRAENIWQVLLNKDSSKIDFP